jgi:regulator of PEP synthase PpsR (kinase-PPPase family)
MVRTYLYLKVINDMNRNAECDLSAREQNASHNFNNKYFLRISQLLFVLSHARSDE